MYDYRKKRLMIFEVLHVAEELTISRDVLR